VANGYDLTTMEPPVAREYSSGESAHRRWKDIWAAGQGLQTIRAVEPTATVVDRMEREYRQAADRFAKLVPTD
jgi:nitronate monooxygenase